MVKSLLSLVLFILNFINIPLKNGYKKLKKWYLGVKEEDVVLNYAFAPFYWIITGLVYAIGFPADKIDKIVNK